jgi:DNA polymerase-1
MIKDSISKNFALVGDRFAADMETALAPECFKGRDCVRLFQAYSPDHEFSIDLAQLDDDEWSELKFNLENPDLNTIWHNANFDLRVLQACGINVGGHIDDTMLMAYLLTNGQVVDSKFKSNVSLAACAFRQLGQQVSKELQAQDWMNKSLSEEDFTYAMNDVRVTWQLFCHMEPQIFEHDLARVYEIELKALLPTIQMESTGLHMDRSLIDSQMLELDETRNDSQSEFVNELHVQLMDHGHDGLPTLSNGLVNLNKKSTKDAEGNKIPAGFNPGSSAQLLDVFKKIGIEPKDRTGKPSVNQQLLADYKEYQIIRTYLVWKKADKHLQMCKTLIKHQQEDGRIYARFNQSGTFTGRYSSSTPNLQNIPRGELRYVFTAPPGRELVDLDYTGMELVGLCSKRVANEPAMASAFIEGKDVHRSTASKMFSLPEDEITDEQRRLAKSVNFAAAYGSSPGGIVAYFQSLGMTISLEQGTDFLNAWIEAYPNIYKWHNTCKNLVDAGEPVRMVDGRRCFLNGVRSKHTIMCNNIVQGSCASAMKLALYGIYNAMPGIDSSARLVGVIHDEVLIECEKGKGQAILDMARAHMIQAGSEIFGSSVSFAADGGIGNSWGAAKS